MVPRRREARIRKDRIREDWIREDWILGSDQGSRLGRSA